MLREYSKGDVITNAQNAKTEKQFLPYICSNCACVLPYRSEPTTELTKFTTNCQRLQKSCFLVRFPPCTFSIPAAQWPWLTRRAADERKSHCSAPILDSLEYQAKCSPNPPDVPPCQGTDDRLFKEERRISSFSRVQKAQVSG